MIVDDPYFSILIPVYNIKRYLHQCVQSVIKQTYKNYEILLIDDGSTDGSGEVCDEYAESYEKVRAYHQKNQGPMKARIEGIRKARGRYCLFVDSDDYILPTLLEEVIKYVESDNLDLLIFNKFVKYQNKECRGSFGRGLYRKVDREGALSAFMSSNQYTAIFTKVIRTSLIRPHLAKMCIPFDYAEDALLTTHFILLSDRIGILDRCLYYYRIRDNSLIHYKTVKRMKDMLGAKEVIYDLIVSAGYLTPQNELDYYGNVLDDFMDGIFRINNIDISMNNRKRDLLELKEVPIVQILLNNKDKIHIAGYNRIRASLLADDRYTSLIILDHILMVIWLSLDFLGNKKRFK